MPGESSDVLINSINLTFERLLCQSFFICFIKENPQLYAIDKSKLMNPVMFGSVWKEKDDISCHFAYRLSGYILTTRLFNVINMWAIRQCKPH